jgi:2-keto-3-deoxygluconate permease
MNVYLLFIKTGASQSKMQSPIKIAPFLCLQVMEMQIKRTIENPRRYDAGAAFLGALCHTFSPAPGNTSAPLPTV